MKPFLLALAALTIAFHASAAVGQEAVTDRVRTVYGEPSNEKNLAIQQAMRGRHILEVAGALLGAFRLPRELTLEVRGCDGHESAWYERDTAIFCYEYVDLVDRHAPKIATPGGVPRADSMVGPVLDTILHEAGHAVFDLLQIPVMGREEDAADFFSVYLLMQFPPADARRLIEGVAFNVGSEARDDLAAKPRGAFYADPHGVNAQRHYNVLCLAYAANPAIFDNEPPAGLPDWRAQDCSDEWAMLKGAFAKLILPHVDGEKLRAAIAQARFGWAPLVTSGASLDRPPLE
jgi:hypothetical protein